MTDHLRAQTVVEASAHSDYHDSLEDVLEYTSEPAVYDPAKRISALVAGSTVELAHYTAISVIVIQNTDPTNFVVVTTYYAAAACAQYLPPGAHTIIYNPTVANDLVITADTAACICRVWIAGTPAV